MEESEKDKYQKRQLQSDRGGAGGRRKTAVGTGGPDDNDCQWQHELPDHKKLRVIVCHRHDLIREGICAIIEPVASVIHKFSDGQSALNEMARLAANRWFIQPEGTISRNKIQMVITDFELGEVNAIDICTRFSGEPGVPNFMIFSDSYHLTRYPNRLIRAGAKAFCLNSSNVQILYDAISHCSRSLTYCDPAVSTLLKQQSITEKCQGLNATTAPPNFNDRETEVLIRISMQKREIAEELDMKPRTVEKHLECILAKLKVPTTTAAFLKALTLGYRMLPVGSGKDLEIHKTVEQSEAEDLALWAIECRARHKQKQLIKFVALNRDLTVHELAMKLSVSEGEIIKRLIRKGFIRTSTQIVELPLSRELARDLGFALSEPESDR